jgi:hypothetical protein
MSLSQARILSLEDQSHGAIVLELLTVETYYVLLKVESVYIRICGRGLIQCTCNSLALLATDIHGRQPSLKHSVNISIARLLTQFAQFEVRYREPVLSVL